MSAPLQIFIAYSRKDADYLAELRTHFTPLERSGKVKVWYDGKIEPGVVWETAIKANLHSADIILLLVSADAIASDYFYEKEMSDALDRHAAGTARVVPLIVRPCAWQETPLGDLQALPKDGLPVTEWPNRDAAYANAIGSLTTTLNLIRSERAAAATQAEQARHRSAEEARRKKAAADHQRQLEEKRKQDAADRLRKTEEERQRKAAAAQLREQQIATVGSTLRSPKVWGSGLVGVLALVLGNWLCDREHTTTLPETTTAQDTTSLTENKPVATDTQAATGVKTLSPEQLPKDVTVQQPNTSSKNSVLLDTSKDSERKQPYPSGKYMVISGGFSVKASADILVTKLHKLGYENARVEPFDRGKYAAVIVDRFDNMSEAERLVKKLKEDGIKSYVKAKS